MCRDLELRCIKRSTSCPTGTVLVSVNATSDGRSTDICPAERKTYRTWAIGTGQMPLVRLGYQPLKFVSLFQPSIYNHDLVPFSKGFMKKRVLFRDYRVDVGVCATLTASLGARGPKKGRTAT